MKYVISYSSGGLGNRMLPLGSILSLKDKHDIIPGVVWDSTLRCGALFNDIFQTSIKTFLLKDLPPEETVIFSNPEWIRHDLNLNGNSALFELSQKVPVLPLESLNSPNFNKKYSVIYHNTFFVSETELIKGLKELTPTNNIIQSVNDFCSINNINKQTIGVHVRGTDFISTSFDPYLNQIRQLVSEGKKIFLCSDVPEWEYRALELYPNNITIRSDKSKLKKHNENSSWVNNVLTTKENTIDGMIDLLILNRCDVQIYDSHSTFAFLAKKISYE